MEAGPRLRIKLYEGWKPIENPRGGPTYGRSGSRVSGALQFSVTTYKAGVLPNSTESQLIETCKSLATKSGLNRVVREQTGNCDFGIFGTVAARGEDGRYMQIWVVSNRQDFILVTHSCTSEPDPNEVEEAAGIALMVGYR